MTSDVRRDRTAAVRSDRGGRDGRTEDADLIEDSPCCKDKIVGCKGANAPAGNGVFVREICVHYRGGKGEIARSTIEWNNVDPGPRLKDPCKRAIRTLIIEGREYWAIELGSAVELGNERQTDAIGDDAIKSH